MESAVFHAIVGGGVPVRRQPAAAHAHSSSQTGGVENNLRNVLAMSRKLLQQPTPPNAQQLESTDSTLFLILAVCGGIGLLVLITFGIIWCVYASKRRERVPSVDSDSAGTDADEPFTDDDKLGAGYLRSETQRASGYGAERKLAMSAQLYHYEKQKRELLALEQGGGQNDVEPPARGTPPPAYTSLNQKPQTTLPSASLGMVAPTTTTTQRASNANDNDDEEFAVYEYPGLVTTVGQVEIDNPLFRAPDVNANDALDSTSRQVADDADADGATPFGAVQIVRQQPDLLAAAGGARRSKRKGKHDANSPASSASGDSSLH